MLQATGAKFNSLAQEGQKWGTYPEISTEEKTDQDAEQEVSCKHGASRGADIKTAPKA